MIPWILVTLFSPHFHISKTEKTADSPQFVISLLAKNILSGIYPFRPSLLKKLWERQEINKVA